jgi:endonuclease YncB( thermonuclease family)
MGCATSKIDFNVNKKDPKQLKIYVPTLYNITVIKVYDGDTITIAAKVSRCSSTFYKFSVRLRGIDTPEIKGKNQDEKQAAIKARDTLSEKILHKSISLKDIKYDKYGRLLAEVYFQGKNMNQWMLDNKLGIAYDGGTKEAPVSWLNYQSTKI